MTSGVKRQRKKLAPDPGVRNALLDAASQTSFARREFGASASRRCSTARS